MERKYLILLGVALAALAFAAYYSYCGNTHVTTGNPVPILSQIITATGFNGAITLDTPPLPPNSIIQSKDLEAAIGGRARIRFNCSSFKGDNYECENRVLKVKVDSGICPALAQRGSIPPQEKMMVECASGECIIGMV